MLTRLSNGVATTRWRALWICADFVGELVDYGHSYTSFLYLSGVLVHTFGETYSASRRLPTLSRSAYPYLCCPSITTVDLRQV